VTDSVAHQIQQWAAQREQRRQLGDRLETPRQIDHTAYFRSRKKAEVAGAELESRGFSVALTPGILRSLVEASRDDALTEPDVARFLTEVVTVVEANGGTYDGFGGPVIP
jgi:hypothetical protein